MLPSGELIVYELEKQWRVIRCVRASLQQIFSPPMLWQNGMTAQPGYLYLTEDPLLPQEAEGLFLCCGWEAPSSDGPEHLSLPDADLWEVFNQLQRMYDRLARWDAELSKVIEQEGTMQQLLDIGSAYIGNLLMVSSVSLDLMFASEQGRRHLRTDEKWDRELNTSDLAAIKDRMVLDRERADVQWIRQPAWEYEFLYANLLEGRAKLGTIVLLPVERALVPRDICLMENLLRYAQQIMRKLAHAGDGSMASLHRGLQLLLGGISQEKERLDHWTLAAGFEPRDHYQCLVVRLPRQIHEEYSGAVSRAVLEQLPRTILFPWKKELVLVLDQEQSADLPEFYRWLEGFLQKSELSAGVSEPFLGLEDLQRYHQEAKAALQLGDGPLTFFEQCRDLYVLQQCMEDLPAELLYSPGFRRVLEHNADTAVDYLETLQVWLDEFGNESRAAARLHICRNTFLYRKKQLSLLLDGETDTADGRFYLMLCLRLMKAAEKCRSVRKMF